MNICVVGTGYVGLVTGVCFAEAGHTVWCVDRDLDKITMLQTGFIPIFESGLLELIKKNRERIRFTTNLAEAIKDCTVLFIAVGTPSGEAGQADLSHVREVALDIGKSINKYMLIVTKSTVPVGTASEVKMIIDAKLKERHEFSFSFDIIANPEFFKEGRAVEDCLRPDRIIIGADNPRAAAFMKALYSPFVKREDQILIMDTKSAEMSKYAANAMLATRISFMNELAQLCDKVGADINKVKSGIGTDRRIGMDFLNAGAGFGGSCFPKDIEALIHMGRQNNIDMEIVSAVKSVNRRQKRYLVDMIERRFGTNLAGLVFGIWGLAFKPQTDDMREASSLVVIKELLARGALVVAYDPKAMRQAQDIFASCENLVFKLDAFETAVNVDAIVLITEWEEFRNLDFYKIKTVMRQPIIFDGRNQYQSELMKNLGFEYYSIGRGNCVK